MDRKLKAGTFLLILFISLFAGCLQGEKEAPKAEPKPVKEVIGIEAVSLDLGHAHVLAISPEGEVFMGLHDGIAVSYDSGKTWREVKVSEEELKDFMAVAVDPKSPNLIYAGGHGHGVWRSDDYGKTWKLQAEGLPSEPDIHALAVAPSSPRVIYAMISGDAMYKSTSSGVTWTRVPVSLDTYAITSLAVDYENPNKLYIGGTATGVLISEDGGVTWQKTEIENLDVASLVMDSEGVLYAGTKGGVYSSEDRGASWKMLKEFQVEAFNLNYAVPGNMFVATKDGSVYMSADGGSTWSEVFRPTEEVGHYPAPGKGEEEGLILIEGPAEMYRPLAWGDMGLKIEGNVTDSESALDGAFDDTTTYTTVRTQGCDSNYAAVYEWQIKKGQEQPVLYYHW
ncbi:MAG: hypothetical protein V3R86_03575, partial [Candidatus Hydrothermarchaeaceae archaeon]